MTVHEYVSALLAAPAPSMTEAGRVALARAVLDIKLAFGEVPAPIVRKRVPYRPASQSNVLYCEVVA